MFKSLSMVIGQCGGGDRCVIHSELVENAGGVWVLVESGHASEVKCWVTKLDKRWTACSLWKMGLRIVTRQG